ncbi:hypothetical protein [Melittangium boletus]|uniref:hypothetical protein n=1 Tax=Melittangium boletus TaxID=83453 RepID=UPI0014752BF9|nr:hypothetical protein [Melittangium boletus]
MHKERCLSLLLAGVASFVGGCQPEASTQDAPETHTARLEGAVGCWSAYPP